jgi:hypothetical protein
MERNRSRLGEPYIAHVRDRFRRVGLLPGEGAPPEHVLRSEVGEVYARPALERVGPE